MAEARQRMCIRIVLMIFMTRYMMNGPMIRTLHYILPLKREFCHKAENNTALYITVISGNNEAEKELDETRTKEMYRRNCDGNAKILYRMGRL